jgi:hypothetical protein
MYVGYLEKFREINFQLYRAAGPGWTAVYEYTSAVDAAGNPTAWKALPIVSDTTGGFDDAGRVTFHPPADWVRATVGGSGRLYHVRLRVTNGTDVYAPIASQIVGRDYVGANGTHSGVIPAFDAAADDDGDGYLNDAEYATRAAGKDARFVYESRLFYPFYGPMRFVTNPSSAVVRGWAADFHERMLDASPLADGIFFDNSGGRLPIAGIAVKEPTAHYTADFAAMLGIVNTAIAPKWVAANTSGGGAETDAVVRAVPATVEEFALRPLASTWAQFLDVADLVARRQAAASPTPYLVLDSLPTGGDPTDARTQLATLAYYYLVGNPQTTFLMFFGGAEPSTTWSRHWSPAAAVDVGLPQGSWTVFATGSDPANAALNYNVYGRAYSKALVLYKPLSYKLGAGAGTLAANTATTHQLGGNYRPVRADGTLGSVVTSVTLRNGEGAVLIKA